MTTKDSTVLVNRGVKQYECWFPDLEATCSKCNVRLEDYHFHEVSDDDEDMQEMFHTFEMSKGDMHSKTGDDNFIDGRTGRKRISAL